MKTILVPVDFSLASKKSIEYALLFANYYPIKLVLVNAWSLPQTHPTATLLLDEDIRQRQEGQMADLIENIRKNDTGEKITVTGVVKDANMVNLIKITALNHQADLIIMATEGISGIMEIFSDTRTGSVLENVSCPVLVIPKEMRVKSPHKIAFASNFDMYDVQHMELLLQWFKPFNASLQIVHVGDPEYREFNEFEDFIIHARHSLNPNRVECAYLDHQDVEKGIQQYIEKNQIDLICFSIRKHTFFQQVFNKSLSKSMANHTRTPLITFPLTEKKQQKALPQKELTL
jgi:nucleotide-binding universal stress UspA family protein